jgi:small subunit ribosomal protein S6
MAFYECIFIARQDITSTQVETLTEQFSGILKENGGEVAAKEQWGLRTLAYKIKKNRKGHYVMLKIEAPSPALLEMERHMRLNEDVLRYMSVRVDELDPQPSAILQNKDRAGRDDRGGRRGRFGDGGPGGGHSGGGRSGGGFSGNRKFDDKAPAQ